MSYYLLDHPNPHGPFFKKTRPKTLAVVIHTAENVPDIVPPDLGAEAVASYGASTQRSVSWHTVVDSDSRIDMVPSGYTAYHVRGYNDRTVGLEIATQCACWADLPDWWVDQAIERAAQVVAEWCFEYDIPAAFITKDDLDAGRKGITSHAQLDPARRSDPGADFPWEAFLGRVRYILKGLAMAWNKPGDKIDDKDDAAKVLRWQGDIEPSSLPGDLVVPFAHVMNRMMELHLDVLRRGA